jgi:hypothetical protein
VEDRGIGRVRREVLERFHAELVLEPAFLGAYRVRQGAEGVVEQAAVELGNRPQRVRCVGAQQGAEAGQQVTRGLLPDHAEVIEDPQQPQQPVRVQVQPAGQRGRRHRLLAELVRQAQQRTGPQGLGHPGAGEQLVHPAPVLSDRGGHSVTPAVCSCRASRLAW